MICTQRFEVHINSWIALISNQVASVEYRSGKFKVFATSIKNQKLKYVKKRTQSMQNKRRDLRGHFLKMCGIKGGVVLGSGTGGVAGVV